VHDADLALEQIRLDLAMVQPKLDRANWVIERQRSAQAQQRIRLWNRLAKWCGIPYAVIQVMGGVMQVCIAAYSLNERVPELQPWMWLLLGLGSTATLFGLVLLVFVTTFVRRTRQKTKPPQSQNVASMETKRDNAASSARVGLPRYGSSGSSVFYGGVLGLTPRQSHLKWR
jgi:hypothetical protein